MYFHLEDKRYEKSLEVAMKGRQLFPDADSFRLVLVDCSIQLKHFALALPHLRESHEKFPENLDILKNYLDVCIQLELFLEGLAVLDEAWKVYKDSPIEGEVLANYTGWMGDYSTALSRWKSLEELEGGQQYVKQMVEAALSAPDHNLILSLLKPQLRWKPPSAWELNALLSAYRGLKLHEEELTMLQSDAAIELMTPFDRQYRYSTLMFDMGRSGESMDGLITLYSEHRPDDGSLRKEILEKALWLKDPQRQLSIFKRFGDLENGDPLQLAPLLARNGLYSEASQQLERLTEDQKQKQEILEVIYEVTAAGGDQLEQLKTLQKIMAMEKDVERKLAWTVERASLYHQLGRINKAEEDARALLAVQEDHPQGLVILGYVSYDRHEYNKAADYLLRSGSTKVYDRFLRGASLLRFQAGYREGVRLFQDLLREYEEQDDFYKWNLVLDIGYELQSPFLIARAWDTIMDRFYTEEVLPRYALHLTYTGRRVRAEEIFNKLRPSEEPSYLALQKIYAPMEYSGSLSSHERLALSDFSKRSGKWFEASLWLP